MQRLTVSLRGGFEQRDNCLLFHFTGQLDAYSEKQFLTYVSDVLEANTSSLVIDLSKIDFLDSSGLGAMVQLAKQCNDAKRSFLVVGNARVAQTMKLVRLEEFLHLVPDLKSALSQLAA
ncbi:MAG: STAS domain-containing protein [Synechococcus sp.]|nr:STAS domain-containing protein [Synechococcus sp.]